MSINNNRTKKKKKIKEYMKVSGIKISTKKQEL